jgi:hypothetical protein
MPSKIYSAVVLARKDIDSYVTTVSESKFIVLPVAAQDDSSTLAQLITQVAALATRVAEAKRADKLHALVELLTPDVQSAETLVREARMIATARQVVLRSAQWLTAEQISVLADFSSTNPSAQPNKWKSKGMIFAIHHRGTDYFPAYGLTSDTHRPIKVLAKILTLFRSSKDGWGLAYWFANANANLGGRKPMDLLHSEPEKVIAAAQDELMGITHG